MGVECQNRAVQQLMFGRFHGLEYRVCSSSTRNQMSNATSLCVIICQTSLPRNAAMILTSDIESKMEAHSSRVLREAWLREVR